MPEPHEPVPPSSSPARGPEQARQIQADLTRMLYAQAPPGLAVTAVNGLLVAAAMSLVSSAWAAWTWFGSLVLVLAARALLLVRFHRAPHLHPDAF